MKSITILLLITLLTGSISVLAQGPPPAMAMPSEKNSKLIDELVNVSGLKDFFTAYCASRIKFAGQTKSWSTAKINEKISSINFEEFKKGPVYNDYSSLTADELTLLIRFFKSAGQRSSSQKFFLSDSMLLTNLNNYSERYLEE
ncbi:hypothetical protein [Pararcticibacter amylolyticus]|uniref:Uncharacterized protein n=1 Tax=Pararcticibacter amylolyticus TaxID=2173175 RepID=A0A2U2PDS0_9SPHI|nr:hypothetical protein [Pararcticibacter amylolyticus]PWG79551.1 hypothetical protein DDR33_15895 [Pararcticibacter amylolyticus]